MKLISQFTNKYNNIVYSIYELKNGIKLVHLQNPTDIDFNFSITVRAGSVYELKEGVPVGTSHFLEHMLFNPNSYYETKQSINRFEEGSKDMPKISINATTTKKNIYFSGGSNSKAKFKVIERVANLIDFPSKKFSNYIEKDRAVILAERSRRPKRGKDPNIAYQKFISGKEVGEFTNSILGESEDIQKICVNDLFKYFSSRFTTGNVIFSIQEKNKLDEKTENLLEEISQRFKKGEGDNFRKYKLENSLEFGAFKDDTANGVFVSFNYFSEQEDKINYREDVINDIAFNIIRKWGFDNLREKKGLVYEFKTFYLNGMSYYHCINGIKFVTEDSKLEEMIKSFKKMIEIDIFKYLKTKSGRASFEDVLSTFIYPRNKGYDEWLAEDCTSTLFESGEIFDENKYIEEGKKVELEDIVNFLKKQFSTPPHIWIESAHEEEKIIERVKKYWK